MAVSTETSLPNFQKNRRRQGPHTMEWQVDTLYAYQLGVISAEHAAFGVTNKGQGLPTIPLTNADEIHAMWIPPHDINTKFPVKIRFWVLPNNAASGITLTTTLDYVTAGEAGDAVALADGATSLVSTHSAITDAETTANTPILTEWAQVNNGTTTPYDALFFKVVASGASGAVRARVYAMQIAYKSIIF